MPIAFMMGVEPKDCRIVAELVGAKTFINEFYAYEKLSEYIENRVSGVGPQLSVGFLFGKKNVGPYQYCCLGTCCVINGLIYK